MLIDHEPNNRSNHNQKTFLHLPEVDEKLDENGRKLEYDRAPETTMRIEDFNMLKYIEW